MFFSKELFSSKDPLGLIWLAGTLKGHGQGSKKISKQRVLYSDIQELSKKIIVPNNDMTLRVRGTLMLGVVVIYQKKTNYIIAEAAQALDRARLVSTLRGNKGVDLAVDLVPVAKEAVRHQAITLPALDDTSVEINLATEALLFDINFSAQWEKMVAERLAGHGLRRGALDMEEVSTACGSHSDYFGSLNLSFDEPDAGVSRTRVQPDVIAEEELFNESIPFDEALILPNNDDGFMEIGGYEAFPDSPIREVEEQVIELPRVNLKASKKRKREEGLLIDENTVFPSDYMRTLIMDSSKLVRERQRDTQGECDSAQTLADLLDGLDTKHRYQYLFTHPIVLPCSDELLAMYSEIVYAKKSSSDEPDAKKLRMSGNEPAPEYEPFVEAGGLDPWADDDPFGGADVYPDMPNTQPVDEKKESTPSQKKSRLTHKSPIRGLEYKTYRTLSFLRDEMNKSDSFGISEDQTLLFSDIQGQKKKRAVNCFYHVLVLATRDYINVEQDAPYCEIRIRKGVNFDQENDQMSMSQQ